ncbi:secreted protein [Melampsora americana]|nr:secreted protein [Melampsora americana]
MMLLKIALVLGASMFTIAGKGQPAQPISVVCNELFNGNLKSARCVSGGTPGTEVNYQCSECHGYPSRGQFCIPLQAGVFPKIGIPHERTVYQGKNVTRNGACTLYERVYRDGKGIGYACSKDNFAVPDLWCNALNSADR